MVMLHEIYCMCLPYIYNETLFMLWYAICHLNSVVHQLQNGNVNEPNNFFNNMSQVKSSQSGTYSSVDLYIPTFYYGLSLRLKF